jgi:glycosyltransferase involved in cell wall biosynthesis
MDHSNEILAVMEQHVPAQGTAATKKLRKLAIVRPSSQILTQDNYNIQEIGLAKALLEFGVSTDVYMAGKVTRTIVSDVFKKNGNSVRLYLLPHLTLRGRQAIFPGLIGLLDRERYDLVQTHEDSQVTSVMVALYGRFRKIPVVLCQGMYRNYEGVIKRVTQKVYDATMLRILKNSVSLCIAKTDQAKEYLREKKFSKVNVCPIGLDTEKFAEYEFVDWKKKYGLSEDSTQLLYVGAIDKRRRVYDLIAGLASLLQGSRSLYLLIAGAGPDRERCEELAASLNLTGKVLFLGTVPQKQLPSLYQSAFAFLMPSAYEIYGMAMLESMYFGVPVISSFTAGADEIIRNNVDGLILDSMNRKLWAKEVGDLLSSPSKRDELGSKAREAIMRKYDWRKASLKFYDAYLSALRRQGE